MSGCHNSQVDTGHLVFSEMVNIPDCQGGHLVRWIVKQDGQLSRQSRGQKGQTSLFSEVKTILYSSTEWIMSDHDMQAQRECPKQIWQRSFLFPSAETNVSYQEQDKNIETQNLINFSDQPGFLSSLELAFSWSSWFSSPSPFAPGCCTKDVDLRWKDMSEEVIL